MTLKELIDKLNKVPKYYGIEAEKGARDALKNIRDQRFIRAAYEHLRIVGNTERLFLPGSSIS